MNKTNYPAIPRTRAGEPMPIVWDDAKQEWRVLRGGEFGQQMELLGPNGQPISSQNRLPVDISADGQPVSESNPLPVKGEMKLSGQDDDIDVAVAADNTRLTSPPTTGTKTVTSTAAELFAGSSRRQGRAFVTVRNLDIAARIRIGPSSVTDETGFGVDPGAVVTLPIDPKSDVPVYAVSEAGDVEVEVLEG